jgi:exosortase J
MRETELAAEAAHGRASVAARAAVAEPLNTGLDTGPDTGPDTVLKPGGIGSIFAQPATMNSAGDSASVAVGLATALSVVGVFSILSTAIFLWALWTTDPLKSIGGFIPVISLVLILRVWRSLNWEMKGTWWGVVLLAATIALVHLRDHAILEFILSPSWAIFLPPHSLVAFCYTAGAVLLFGGVRLFRAALFPVVLMWFVNPMPNFFTLHIDLPLQHASSLIARGFAHGLGQKLTPDQLRLMFTPDFGMFIAPGCNGIRGAITMGMIALIAGYLYKFRVRVWAAVVAGAVLLGYVFNLVRLCALVLYYIVALHIPWLQTRAEMGDYIIGACLFFCATALLFVLIERLSPEGSLRPPRLTRAADVAIPRVPKSFWWRWTAFAVLVALGSVSYAKAVVQEYERPRAVSDPKALGLFPQRVGGYTLKREWNEYLGEGGPLIFYWADYVPEAVGYVPGAVGYVPGAAGYVPGAAGAARGGGVAATDGHTPDGGIARDGDSGVVSVGISPVLGAHDTLICHAARGEDWLWHGDLWLPTTTGAASFSGSFFNTGARQYLEATTVCSGATCGQYSTNRKHFGLVYSRPDTRTVLSQSPTRPIPILLRTETLNTSMAADAARAELTANLQHFLAGANLAVFTKPYREP